MKISLGNPDLKAKRLTDYLNNDLYYVVNKIYISYFFRFCFVEKTIRIMVYSIVYKLYQKVSQKIRFFKSKFFFQFFILFIIKNDLSR